MEHQSLKTLQQRVVQLPGDPGSFGQTLFESQGELGFRHLAHAGHHRRNHPRSGQESNGRHHVERVSRRLREPRNKKGIQAENRHQGDCDRGNKTGPERDEYDDDQVEKGDRSGLAP